LQQELEAAVPASVALFKRQPVQPVEQQQAFSPDAYAQNQGANQLYNTLKSGKVAPRNQQAGLVRVGVNDFAWHTLALTRGPALGALRVVSTPDGPLAQGS